MKFGWKAYLSHMGAIAFICLIQAFFKSLLQENLYACYNDYMQNCCYRKAVAEFCLNNKNVSKA